jgi:hypothetical protein
MKEDIILIYKKYEIRVYKMKYKIYDKINKEYLDLRYYVVNGFGDVITIKGDVFMNQNDFEIQIEMKKEGK